MPLCPVKQKFLYVQPLSIFKIEPSSEKAAHMNRDFIHGKVKLFKGELSWVQSLQCTEAKDLLTLDEEEILFMGPKIASRKKAVQTF